MSHTLPRRSFFAAAAAVLVSLLTRCNLAPAAQLPDVDPETDPPLPVPPERPEPPRPYQLWRLPSDLVAEPTMFADWEHEHEARRFLDENDSDPEDFRFELRVDLEQQELAERLLAESSSLHRHLPRKLRQFCDEAKHDRVPGWLTPAMIRTRAARAAYLSRLIDNELTIEFSPSSFGDDDHNSQGHCFVVPLCIALDNYVIDDRKPDLPGQMAETLRNCADWLNGLAAKAEAVKGGVA